MEWVLVLLAVLVVFLVMGLANPGLRPAALRQVLKDIQISNAETLKDMVDETDSTRNSPSTVTPAPSRSTHDPRPTDTEFLSSLATIYYGMALLFGVVLIGFTIANADELSSTEIGAWVGYTVGAVLSMFAVGRVIELLQQIRDAVRNNPALSPGRPDAE